MSLAYYNEIDPYSAEWLRNLIAAGHIAPGVVDSRDIRDVLPSDLRGFTQCHFFAGVGVWSHALRRAGFGDDREIWTGSCPCQPFSAAGRAGGFTDERHLWPHWHYLIEQCGPSVVLGEQVASKDGLGWYDLVSADLEGTGYAVGALDLCAAGIGVEWQDSQGGEWLRRAIHDCTDPRIATALSDFADWAGAGNIGDGGKHIRQRLYFVGLADSGCGSLRSERRELGDAPGGMQRAAREQRVWSDGRDGGAVERLADPMHAGRPEGRAVAGNGQIAGSRTAGGMDDDNDARPQGHAGDASSLSGRAGTGGRSIAAPGVSVGLADDLGKQRPGCAPRSDDAGRRNEKPATLAGLCSDIGADATNGRRYAKDWLFCRDDRWRAVESGTFPLVNGAAARVGKLRAFGNALDAETATRFCETVKDICDG